MTTLDMQISVYDENVPLQSLDNTFQISLR